MDSPSLPTEKESKYVDVTVAHELGHESDQSNQTAVIDPEVERRCIRKFDRLVMPQMLLIYLLSYLDRSNLGNARVMGLEADTGLTGTQFNNVATLFFVTYGIFEIAWGISIKTIGANRAVAIGIIGWSAVTIGTGFAQNYHQLIACRLLLGVFESASPPCFMMLISMMYPRQEQSKRNASIFYGICMSGAFGGLIAYGVQVMGPRHGLAAWRWLFIIEGALSLVCGILSWLSLPTSAEMAWFLDAEERATMAAIRQRDVAYRGKEKFEWRSVRLTLTDPIVILCALTGFALAMPILAVSLFAPTLILALGYNRLESNYLSIPLFVVATLALALFTWLSDKLNRRAMIMIGPIFVGILGYAMAIGSESQRVGFGAMFLVAAGVFPCQAIFCTWFATNISPDNKRATAVPIFLSTLLSAGALSAQLYPSSDGPRYIMGNAVSLAVFGIGACGVFTLWFIWRQRNAQKSKAIAEGATANKYEDDRGLDFEYVL